MGQTTEKSSQMTATISQCQWLSISIFFMHQLIPPLSRCMCVNAKRYQDMKSCSYRRDHVHYPCMCFFAQAILPVVFQPGLKFGEEPNKICIMELITKVAEISNC